MGGIFTSRKFLGPPTYALTVWHRAVKYGTWGGCVSRGQPRPQSWVSPSISQILGISNMHAHGTRNSNQICLVIKLWKDNFYKVDHALSLPPSLCLSPFYRPFPGEPGLASVYWSKGWWKWWWQLELLSHAKLQSNHHHQKNQHPVFLQAGYPSCRPTNSVKARTEGKNITLPALA